MQSSRPIALIFGATSSMRLRSLGLGLRVALTRQNLAAPLWRASSAWARMASGVRRGYRGAEVAQRADWAQ